ncbi:hypothetical protein WJX72_005626 [[Myrmecia] bisecta]|uniref:Uncharacterized protein n=1 Tax=[Myrmecia] bisecta TaxID=41462 RepID=A0AAW1P3G8_9CHLO
MSNKVDQDDPKTGAGVLFKDPSFVHKEALGVITFQLMQQLRDVGGRRLLYLSGAGTQQVAASSFEPDECLCEAPLTGPHDTDDMRFPIEHSFATNKVLAEKKDDRWCEQERVVGSILLETYPMQEARQAPRMRAMQDGYQLAIPVEAMFRYRSCPAELRTKHLIIDAYELQEAVYDSLDVQHR